MITGDEAKRTRVAALVLGAAILILYARTVGYPLLIGDDNYNIRYNPYFHPLTFGNLLRAWTAPYLDLYIPVTLTTWGLLGMIARTIPAIARSTVLHSADLVIHYANCILVFLIAREVLAGEAGNVRGRAGDSWLPVLLGATMFAVHPLQVKNVAWVTGLKDLLGSFFSLLSLRAFLAAEAWVWRAESGGIAFGARSTRQYAWATVWFILGILSKPSTVCLPALAAALSWIMGRSWYKAIAATTPWLVVSAAITAWTFAMQGLSEVHSTPYWVRPFSALDNLGFYALKILFPYPIAHEITHHAMVRVETVGFWVAVCALALGAWFAWRVRESHRAIVGGLVFAALGLSPILGLVSYGHQAFSEVATHYVYLPMAGLAISAAAFLSAGYRATRLALAGVALVALSVLTYMHVPTYSSDDALIAQIFKLEPDNLWGHTDLGVSLLRRGQFERALEEARKALDLNKNAQASQSRVLTVLIAMGRDDDVVHEVEAEIATHPKALVLQANLAYALILLGRVDEGVRKLEEVARKEPVFAREPNEFAHSVLSEARFLEMEEPILRGRLEKAFKADPTLSGIGVVLQPLEPVWAM